MLKDFEIPPKLYRFGKGSHNYSVDDATATILIDAGAAVLTVPIEEKEENAPTGPRKDPEG